MSVASSTTSSGSPCSNSAAAAISLLILGKNVARSTYSSQMGCPNRLACWITSAAATAGSVAPKPASHPACSRASLPTMRAYETRRTICRSSFISCAMSAISRRSDTRLASFGAGLTSSTYSTRFQLSASVLPSKSDITAS